MNILNTLQEQGKFDARKKVFEALSKKSSMVLSELAMPYSEFKGKASLWQSVARKAGHTVKKTGSTSIAISKHGDIVGKYDHETDSGHLAGSSVN